MELDNLNRWQLFSDVSTNGCSGIKHKQNMEWHDTDTGAQFQLTSCCNSSSLRTAFSLRELWNTHKSELSLQALEPSFVVDRSKRQESKELEMVSAPLVRSPEEESRYPRLISVIRRMQTVTSLSNHRCDKHREEVLGEQLRPLSLFVHLSANMVMICYNIICNLFMDM